MPDVGLLLPGVPEGLADDVALVRAMLAVEVAWSRTLVSTGRADAASAARVAEVADALAAEPAGFAAELAAASAATGNPVIALVARLRAEAGDPHAAAVHTGLTSQDVVDTALVLVTRDAAHDTRDGLHRARVALTRLARTHRETPALARTLAQAAAPTTFGARFAGWLQGVAEAEDRLAGVAFPVAWGGAAGTLESVPGDRLDVLRPWAAGLGLAETVAPWHTTRAPVLRIGGAFAEVCAALGTITSDVLAAARPGVEELGEPAGAGRGASSAMPFKRNPVASVLIRRSALVAPHALAQLHTAAGLAVDERPDGAWHAEWPALRELARHAASASALAAELLEGLEVHPDAAARLLAAHPEVGDDPGAAVALVDRALESYGADA
ncbi:lyase family protein [Protaetiibacter intestinalis]|uniref:Adenylosuccinate lyase n=1 Tax=Protaetiibacter intestinalis TaxID=2419774 RepID=A0A387B795_9MICO|nr:lyase family protein [Protaetiibacter intestinalis]AYF98227.1 adenylosuccinate lyase [Protaetiibacter intestinalis]